MNQLALSLSGVAPAVRFTSIKGETLQCHVGSKAVCALQNILDIFEGGLYGARTPDTKSEPSSKVVDCENQIESDFEPCTVICGLDVASLASFSLSAGVCQLWEKKEKKKVSSESSFVCRSFPSARVGRFDAEDNEGETSAKTLPMMPR